MGTCIKPDEHSELCEGTEPPVTCDGKIPPCCGCPVIPSIPPWPWFDSFNLPSMPPLPTIPIVDGFQLLDTTNFSIKGLVKIFIELLGKILSHGMVLVGETPDLLTMIKAKLSAEIDNLPDIEDEEKQKLKSNINDCASLSKLKSLIVSLPSAIKKCISVPWALLMSGFNALSLPNKPDLPSFKDLYDKLTMLECQFPDLSMPKLDNFSIKYILDLLNDVVGKLTSLIPIPPDLAKPALPSITIKTLYEMLKEKLLQMLDALKQSGLAAYDTLKEDFDKALEVGDSMIDKLKALQEYAANMLKNFSANLLNLSIELPCKIFGEFLADICFTFSISMLKLLTVDIPSYLGLAALDVANFSFKQLANLLNDILKYIEKLVIITIVAPQVFFMSPHYMIHDWMYDENGNFTYVPNGLY